MQSNTVAKAMLVTGVALVLAAPFLGFDFARTSSSHWQALSIWVATVLLVCGNWFSDDRIPLRRGWVWLPLGLFVYALLSTTILSGASPVVFFGLANEWLGSWSTLSLIAIGLVAAQQLTIRSLNYLYWTIVGLAGVSLLFGAPQIMQGLRLTGVVNQSNVLAIIAGAGALVGAYALEWKKLSWGLAASQGLLFGVVVFTGTRAVLYMLILLYLPLVARYWGRAQKTGKSLLLLVAAGATLALFCLSPRTVDIQQLSYGATYRFDLTSHSLAHTAIMPAWGLGPGQLNTVILDYYPLPVSLQKTLDTDQAIPESSHNIFVDRLLEYGWLGGLAYLVVVVQFGVVAYRRRNNRFMRTLSIIGVYLIVQHTVTVTRLLPDLLLWVILLTIIFRSENIDA